jgi:hypothetical protein
LVADAMQAVSCPILGPSATASAISEAKAQLKALLATHLNRASLKYRR